MFGFGNYLHLQPKEVQIFISQEILLFDKIG